MSGMNNGINGGMNNGMSGLTSGMNGMNQFVHQSSSSNNYGNS
jgi:hypothetical protein